MKTYDDLHWDFKQETELNNVYRKNNNTQPFNESYVRWLEDKILLANEDRKTDSNCNIHSIVRSLMLEKPLDSGWSFDIDFLKALTEKTEKMDFQISMEQVENVLLALAEQ